VLTWGSDITRSRPDRPASLLCCLDDRAGSRCSTPGGATLWVDLPHIVVDGVDGHEVVGTTLEMQAVAPTLLRTTETSWQPSSRVPSSSARLTLVPTNAGTRLRIETMATASICAKQPDLMVAPWAGDVVDASSRFEGRPTGS
jgi:hypothetical protein